MRDRFIRFLGRLRRRIASLPLLSGDLRLRIAGLAPIAGGAANECLPLYDPGATITAAVTAAVTGKRCVAISGGFQSGPGLSNTGEGGNIQVAHAAAAGRIFGVAAYDQPTVGAKVPVERGAGKVLPITAGAAIAAGAEVEVGANGQVVTKAAGIPVGVAVGAAAGAGVDCFVSLYDGGTR